MLLEKNMLKYLTNGALLCKDKRQHLLTCEVSRYCLLTLYGWAYTAPCGRRHNTENECRLSCPVCFRSHTVADNCNNAGPMFRVPQVTLLYYFFILSQFWFPTLYQHWVNVSCLHEIRSLLFFAFLCWIIVPRVGVFPRDEFLFHPDNYWRSTLREPVNASACPAGCV